MKLHIIKNLMIYVWHSRCKYFSPQTWLKFVRFDFLKNLYARHYGMKGVAHKQSMHILKLRHCFETSKMMK